MNEEADSKPRIGDAEVDILVEIASIAANHAAGALSKMIGERIDVEVPILELAEIERAREVVGHAEENMTGVNIQITGDVRGVVFLLLTPQDGQQLVADIAHGQDVSALEEVANIITGAALGSLQRFLGLQFHQTVPGSASDMLGAVVNDTIAEAGSRTDHILMLGMQFLTGRHQTRGRLFFIFEPDSTQAILKASHNKAEAMK